jgi:hypothetical protein
MGPHTHIYMGPHVSSLYIHGATHTHMGPHMCVSSTPSTPLMGATHTYPPILDGEVELVNRYAV